MKQEKEKEQPKECKKFTKKEVEEIRKAKNVNPNELIKK